MYRKPLGMLGKSSSEEVRSSEKGLISKSLLEQGASELRMENRRIVGVLIKNRQLNHQRDPPQ